MARDGRTIPSASSVVSVVESQQRATTATVGHSRSRRSFPLAVKGIPYCRYGTLGSQRKRNQMNIQGQLVPGCGWACIPTPVTILF